METINGTYLGQVNRLKYLKERKYGSIIKTFKKTLPWNS